MSEKEQQSTFFNLNPNGNITVRPGGETPLIPKTNEKKAAMVKKPKSSPEDRWAWTNQDKD